MAPALPKYGMSKYAPTLKKTYAGQEWQFYIVRGLRVDNDKPFYVRMHNKSLQLEFNEDGGLREPWYLADDTIRTVAEWCWLRIQEIES